MLSRPAARAVTIAVMQRSRRLVLTTALAALTASAASPIRLHPKNPHYFEFRGKAVALITSGEHSGAVINGAFDYRRYLETLAKDGLNLTRLFGGSYIEIPGQSFGIRRNDLAPEPGQFIAPWARSGDKFDLERWNPEYFARYRDFLAEAGKRGIVVEVNLFSSQYQEAHWKVSPFNPAKQCQRRLRHRLERAAHAAQRQPAGVAGTVRPQTRA